MFNNPPIIKTDALRRGTAMRPPSPTPAPVGALSPDPQMAQMMEALKAHPGMTPEGLRMILEDLRMKKAAKPVLAPSDVVAGVNYRNPL